ncbi:hypothetical protein J2Z65_006672 [Paenibacillus aceris]|uniref:Uncharacterized protein n=1 Tax=Paenibacillus aceris TaxID=869555 RepID=A0ABS4IAL1_9BACL|nr:hypothetical protein [Paenibacillus aceris]
MIVSSKNYNWDSLRRSYPTSWGSPFLAGGEKSKSDFSSGCHQPRSCASLEVRKSLTSTLCEACNDVFHRYSYIIVADTRCNDVSHRYSCEKVSLPRCARPATMFRIVTAAKNPHLLSVRGLQRCFASLQLRKPRTSTLCEACNDVSHRYSCEKPAPPRCSRPATMFPIVTAAKKSHLHAVRVPARNDVSHRYSCEKPSPPHCSRPVTMFPIVTAANSHHLPTVCAFLQCFTQTHSPSTHPTASKCDFC